MNKLMIVGWLWVLGTGAQINFNFLDLETSKEPAYVVTKSTVLASTFYANTDGAELFLRADSTKTCTDCHKTILDNEEVHAPAKKDCERCHISSGVAHPNEKMTGFTLKKDVPGLCYECHDPKNEEEFVHDPTQKGKCLTCHDAHNSPNLYLVKSDPISGLCFECHDKNIPKNDMVHGAYSEGKCQACHNPHQADNEKFIASSNLSRMCGKCHKSIRKELKKDFVHGPFTKKGCLSCHNGHSSKEAHLSDFTTQELCFSCHEDTHNTIKNASVVHGAINDTQACLNCHSPHSSAEQKILKKKEKDMCLSCHNTSITTDDKSISAIGPHLEEGNTIHGAIDEGCIVCHMPHASQEHTLLNKKFPVKNYVQATTDNFDLCFTCHDNKLFEGPITEEATNFRNGNQNLHYLHIQGEDGRNCSLCHDVHGAKNKYMIKEKTRFGKWQMPIEFKLMQNGGSCLTGCHAERSYERIIVIDSLKLNE